MLKTLGLFTFLAATLGTSPVVAQVVPPGQRLPPYVCAYQDELGNYPNHDRWTLEPHPTMEGVYRFSYWNSTAKCSFNRVEGVVAEDGFRIILNVEIDHYPDSEDEYISVEPEDNQYMAIPPELRLGDGEEPGVILIYPGIV